MKKEHFEVILEEMRSHFDLLGEGLEAQRERAERDKKELKQEIASVYDILAHGLEAQREKAERDKKEFNHRFDRLETKVDTLETKVDTLDKGQREISQDVKAMRAQIEQVVEVQQDHVVRPERLELSVT